MQFQPLSPKQADAALWWLRPDTRDCDGIICDGAVRSGKTMTMTLGFLLWALSTFPGGVFALCGRTIESFRRNVTSLLPGWLEGLAEITETRSENKIVFRCGERHITCYLFGGQNEQSYTLIQGMTLHGALLDEVALMPRSFVEQVMARCSIQGSKLFFSCNPRSPGHWFYKEWILRAKERNIHHLHFTMDDNLSLSREVREKYKRMFTGMFYRRYVLGEWCLAEGLVYDFREEMISEQLPPGFHSYYISVDYGTRNPCSMGLWALSQRTGEALRLREVYYDSRAKKRQMTDEDYYNMLEELAGDKDISAVIVDPSALSFITTIRRHGRFSVKLAKNDVLTGIRTVADLLGRGKIRIHPDCRDAIREFSLYRWEEGDLEKPCKENDHAMDEIRYFAMTILRRYNN